MATLHYVWNPQSIRSQDVKRFTRDLCMDKEPPASEPGSEEDKEEEEEEVLTNEVDAERDGSTSAAQAVIATQSLIRAVSLRLAVVCVVISLYISF